MKRIVKYAAILLLPVFLFSQEYGKITGSVTDDASGDGLAGANVLLEGTSLGASSDADGQYMIIGVPIGSYTVRVEYIGYRTVRLSDVRVSGNLTSEADFALTSEAIEAGTIDVIAERPIINKSATNTNRLVRGDDIRNMPLRGVGAVVALQTGVVVRQGAIHIRGSRAFDTAFMIDGVLMNNPWDRLNNSQVSSAAIEEISVQTGGMSAEVGNANGGLINTTSRTGRDQLDISGEFITGLGASGAGDKEGLYSYGYNLYSLNVGGPLGSKIRYFASFEQRGRDDRAPSVAPHFTMDRTVFADSFPSDLSGYEFTDTEVSIISYDENYVPTRDTTLLGYSNFKEQFGSKPNAGGDRTTLLGNLVLDFKPLRIKLGGSQTKGEARIFSHIGNKGMLNSELNDIFRRNVTSVYANLTLSLGARSFVKLNLSSYNNIFEEGNQRYWGDDNIGDRVWEKYGQVGADKNFIKEGQNQAPINLFANTQASGIETGLYHLHESSYFGIRADYLNQIGQHEIKAGFDMRNNTIKMYHVSQGREIASRELLRKQGGEELTDDFIWGTYRDAYTFNLGYSIDGKESGNGFQDAATPVIMGAYVKDKIELEDLIVNIGFRWDSYDYNTTHPTDGNGNPDWRNIWLINDLQVNRDSSNWTDTPTHSFLLPRIGFSFPVSDRTKMHAEYGQFSQHPVFNRLYLSDAQLSANLTQGNATVSPNPSLLPERTTQYEIGLSKQVGDYIGIDVTGFYKEVRDFTLMRNLFGARRNGSEFVWAQYQTGDFGIIKGLAFNFNMRRVRGLTGNASYTLQWASGTGSDPRSNFTVAWLNGNEPKLINPLDFDQRHTGSIVIDYRTQSTSGLLANAGINLVFQFASGTAFTPIQQRSILFSQNWNRPLAGQNSSYLPGGTNLDLKIDKDVNLGGATANVYIWVINVLNAVNVNEIYATSGEAGSDGWLKSPAGQSWLAANPGGDTYYNARTADPGRWDLPRMVRLGISFQL